MAPSHPTYHHPSSQAASVSTPPYAPPSLSVTHDSDTDFDPTPTHSPGGPQYEHLPPSYHQAQEQAVVDARNGVAPLEASRLEAHRLTFNEGPNEPQVWEYRLRGQDVDSAEDHEPAPEYGSPPPHLAATVPVQYVERSENSNLARVRRQPAQQENGDHQISDLFSKALEFTQLEHVTDANSSPLPRLIAIPPVAQSSQRLSAHIEPVQFIGAYARLLRTHSIHPAEFSEFLEALNALCRSFHAITKDLLPGRSPPFPSKNSIHEYVKRVNQEFFQPRGLLVSLQSLPTLLSNLNICADQDQRSGLITTLLDANTTAEQRAEALYPQIEVLEFHVLPATSRNLAVREKGDRLSASTPFDNIARDYRLATSPSTQPREASPSDDSDPPHSIPQSPDWRSRPQGSERRDHYAQQPHCPPEIGSPADYSQHPPSFEPPEPPSFSRASYGSGPGQARSTNESEALGRDMGKWGEEYGKSMGKWGEAYGRSMGKWGEEFGRSLGAWGQDVGRNAGAWGQGVGRGWNGQTAPLASGSHPSRMASNTVPVPYEHLPPSYEQATPGQESGVFPGDRKINTEGPSATKGKAKRTEINEDDDSDDDASTISSDTSDSDSNSDSDSDEPDPEATLQKRLLQINEKADKALAKGKKSPPEIAQDRSAATKQAHAEKTATELQTQRRNSKYAALRHIKQRGRDLKREHRQRKHELRAAHNGKGKGKAKKSREWREAKREYRVKRKELRKEKVAARKEWRAAKKQGRKKREEIGLDHGDLEDAGDMVWIVIQNWDQKGYTSPARASSSLST